MAKTCSNCGNWDSRPEEGMDSFSGYCEAKDRITNKDYTCELWVKPNTVSVEEMYENGDPFNEAETNGPDDFDEYEN